MVMRKLMPKSDRYLTVLHLPNTMVSGYNYAQITKLGPDELRIKLVKKENKDNTAM